MLKKIDYLGFNHDKVAEKFEGDLTFVNYMNVNDTVMAVYHAKNPNKKKGHKEFMLLFYKRDPVLHQTTTYVSGMERAEIEKFSTVEGMKCLTCGVVLFSMTRHDFHSCGCENDMFVDGGVDYLRAGAKDLMATSHVTINLLTNEIIVQPRKKR